MSNEKTAGKRAKAPAYQLKTYEEVHVTETDMYLFGAGAHYDIFKKLGAHPIKKDGKKGVCFAVWASAALEVYVIGEFNGWNETSHPMKRLEPQGIFELFVPGVKEGCLYKYLIITAAHQKLYKADPFANFAERRPGNASRVFDINRYTWKDDKWMSVRDEKNAFEQPVAIYEVHPGSWKRPVLPEGATEEECENNFYNYRELAVALADYVKEMGYTHIEFMGIAEFPFDGSWGYQVTGYYAPTSRYGTPADFKYMIDYLHRKGIGVILDWVPAHFPRDAHGLAEFDGSCLFEYADPRKGEHPDWGTKIFDFGKYEVKNFLIANALFWVEQYHVDGLRVDAVASMLYLDYGKQDGQWVANKYGGNQNLEAIEFFKHLNSLIRGRHPGVLMIAEESTAWPNVTKRPEEDGLGFTFKWNMGWMHDFLDYMKLDPYFRKDNHNKMTFAMSYNSAEKYILVLSHDEVVHLKCSMLNKMPGLYDDKFANLRVGYTFMMGHPGKKLLFMGQDFGQLREWSEARELDWFLLAEDAHRRLHDFYKALLHLYRKYPCMYEWDHDWRGFEWINANDAYRSIFSFVRHGKSRRRNLLFVCNFTPVAYPDYRVGVPRKKKYKLVLDGDRTEFGGNGKAHEEIYMAAKGECDGQPYSIAYDLSAYGVAVFEF